MMNRSRLPDVVITGLTLSHVPTHGEGRCLLAHFDFEIVGLRVCGCSLLRTEKGGMAMGLPRLEKDDCRRRITITDDAVRNAVMTAARATYIKMGGCGLPHWAMKNAALMNETEAA